MRTVAGGDVRKTAVNPNAPEYLQKRAAQIAPLLEKAGIESWPEFAARYSLEFASVRATVGSTARPEALDEFIAVTQDPAPLPRDIVNEILHLQRHWSDDFDRHAAPWTM